ncbi:Thioredoxin domain-containing protein 1 [Operophtera brumata]|uniref:Thioredoxin domain-containing protein 1 n=1 Tax=Operophtera brumata TaxID=104452 RepID=A0A0L7LQV2_OPEBR|nr:Thioredoxin domain-containing protein 1 [Operophtera brumata]
MARVLKMPQFLPFFSFTSLVLCCYFITGVVESANRDLDEDNWRDILNGEWMELSSRAERKGLDTRTGAVDVTKSPGLSGRFVVTALPTIFQDADSMLTFVQQKRWKQTDPIPSWKAPHSLQMTFVSEFFKLSQALRRWKQTDPIPSWKTPHSLQMTFVSEFFKLSQALRRWKQTDPIPSWKAPHSLQMTFVSEFFKLS